MGSGGAVAVIVHDTSKGKVEVICGQGPAPAGATMAHLRGCGLDVGPGTGVLAGCVPGTFETWMLLLRDHGTMRLADVLEPAIAYATQGHPLVERASATIASVEQLFREHWPTSAQVYLPGGRVPQPGTLFTNRGMAETYRRILSEAQKAGGSREQQIDAARRAWSQGFVADATDRFCRTQAVMDTSGTPHRGVLTGADMAAWRPLVEAPLTYDYGRYTVCKAGPWNQGPVMLQQLALLKGFDLEGADPTSADFIHTLVECSKLAYADRETFYGDPKFVDVPMGVLISDDYNNARRKLVTGEASLELRPGTIKGYGKALGLRAHGTVSGGAGAGEPTVGRTPWTHDEKAGVAASITGAGVVRGDTVHFDIVDRAGNMVSATPSGGWLQSSPLIPELGFCLGTRAQMFWLEDGHPAALAPGKRPRTTLTPPLALRDGEPYLAWGTPGGDQQDQWTTQLLLRHAHAGMNLQQAIDAPAWHSEHFPSSFWPREARPGVLVGEGRMPKATVKELERRGHKVEIEADWSEGRLTAASRDGRRRRAAANPRGMQGYAPGR